MYVMAASEIFQRLVNLTDLYLEVSFFEIYGNKLFDLLENRRKIVCREDGNQRVNIIGLKVSLENQAIKVTFLC